MALYPSRWIAALDCAVDAVGATGAMLIPLKAEARRPGLLCTDGLAEATDRYLKEGWWSRDLRERGLPRLRSHGVMVDQDFTTAEEMRRSDYYNELLAQCGVRWFAGILVDPGDEPWCLAIQRSQEEGPFTPAEQRKLVRLRSPLASAAAIARAFDFARAEAALGAFEVSGLAVALIDRFGRAIRLNAAAEGLLGPDFNVIQGRIACANCEATATFDRTLHALLWASSGQSLMPPVALPRADKRPLLAYALRPPAICADVFGACQAIVVFVDPDERPRPPEALLRTAFGLSTAEARIASLLATGESLQETADALKITYETARTELKRVFLKLGVSRQAEMVALLSRVSPQR